MKSSELWSLDINIHTKIWLFETKCAYLPLARVLFQCVEPKERGGGGGRVSEMKLIMEFCMEVPENASGVTFWTIDRDVVFFR